LKTILIKGTTDSLNKYYNNDKTFRIANYLTSTDMSEVIQQSGIIISRPGYSTVMDLARLGSKAIFIPTPGQTEQEFLAKTLTEQRIAYSIKQSHFDLLKALKEAENYKGFSNFEPDESLLQNAIDSL
jgi:UDP-N-acetylglucosamine:LPS N-acetylglucosamine transferase